ncbi:MAG: hypothetical protein AAGK04_12035 [Planctomycetota bacterium]
MVLKQLGKLLGGGRGDDRPVLRAAVFGKHPGWDDHMEELGLTTTGLVELRRTLYSEGLTRIIDSGEWEGLEPSERLDVFDHAFARRGKGSLVVGRLWSSEDGRGRTKYPMIVAVECEGLPATRAIEIAEPACARAKAAFVATRGADDVRAAFRKLQGELDKAASNASREPEPAGRHVRALERMEGSPTFRPSDGASAMEGLCRVVHAMDSELGAQLGAVGRGSGSGTTSWTARARQVSERGGHVRGPGLGGGSSAGLHSGVDVGRSLGAWMDLVEPLTGSRLALMVVLSPEGWLDVIAGDASSSSLVCLRTSAAHTPMASEVPYEVPGETRRRVEDILKPNASDASGAAGAGEESR